MDIIVKKCKKCPHYKHLKYCESTLCEHPKEFGRVLVLADYDIPKWCPLKSEPTTFKVELN